MSNGNEILDDIDTKILQILQKNSRTTIADIAREIDELTENAIRYRIDRLESDGYIANYTMQLNPKKFEKNIMAIFNLNVLPENINETLEYLKTLDYLTEIYLTTGDFSIITMGYFKDNKEITMFITEHLRKVKMIDYDVITVLNRVKHSLFSI